MIFRIFMFLIGFGLSVIGSIYIISYLNLLSMGYNFLDYVNFIIRRFECIILPLGLLLISLTIFIPGGNKNELYL